LRKVDPEKFKEMWLAGKSVSEIAKEFNCTVDTLKYWRKKLGLPKRRPLPKPRINLHEVIKLIRMGYSCHEAAKLLGYAPMSVVFALNRIGLSCRELRKGSKIHHLRSLIDEILNNEGVIIYSEFLKHYGRFNMPGHALSIRHFELADPDLKIIKLRLGGYGGARTAGRKVFGRLMKYNGTYIIFRDWSKFKEFILKHVVITPENKNIVAARLRRSRVPRQVAKEIVDEGLKLYLESQKT